MEERHTIESDCFCSPSPRQLSLTLKATLFKNVGPSGGKSNGIKADAKHGNIRTVAERADSGVDEGGLDTVKFGDGTGTRHPSDKKLESTTTAATAAIVNQSEMLSLASTSGPTEAARTAVLSSGWEWFHSRTLDGSEERTDNSIVSNSANSGQCDGIGLEYTEKIRCFVSNKHRREATL